MRYISVFTGLGSDAIALSKLGWDCLAFSEIEPFQSAVLKFRYPSIANMGDMVLVPWDNFSGHCDVIIGGPPCPAFSTAGRRGSLNDYRGNLLMEYAEAINAVSPIWTITENVEGLLNTSDNAFGRFLARLVGTDAQLVPPGVKRWPCSGMVAGPKRAACWRVLSAEHFGLPQRRRRLFVVSHSRDWTCAAKVLLEPKGPEGNTEDRGEDLPEAASSTGRGLHQGSWNIKPEQRLGQGFYIYDRFNNTISPVAPAIGTNCGLQTGRTIGVAVGADGSLSARRLTPDEMERLQGFPPGWSNIPWRKRDYTMDRPRYVAIGNAFPPPMIEWIGRRIQLVEEEKGTPEALAPGA